MLLRYCYDTKLAQASYLVGCSTTGEALVIDPNRHIEQYLELAAGEGLRVAHVTETHIHADFVSGSRELAARSGARLYLSDEGDPAWKYQFGREPGVSLIREGDVIRVGRIELAVRHTPGHTPEHLAFVLTDTAATDRAMGVFTGDFIFAGDVGRPDLLERAANMHGTMDAAARTLFRSLQRFKSLPDYLQIWPGHGAGSACGKTLGAVPSTTLGYERLVNWGLVEENEEEFVRRALDGQPEPPKYFALMKRINKEGPPIAEADAPRRLEAGLVAARLAAGEPVVDVRSAAEHRSGHLHGSVGIPLNRSFPTWAGWLLPYDRDLVLVATDEAHATCAARDLRSVGIDRVAGFAAAADVANLPEWRGGAKAISGDEVAKHLRDGTAAVIDVRGGAEWHEGHIPGARHIPLGTLADEAAVLPRDRTVVVHCQGGSRSAIAASLLEAQGFSDVRDFRDGFSGWQAERRPVVPGEEHRASPR